MTAARSPKRLVSPRVSMMFVVVVMPSMIGVGGGRVVGRRAIGASGSSGRAAASPPYGGGSAEPVPGLTSPIS